MTSNAVRPRIELPALPTHAKPAQLSPSEMELLTPTRFLSQYNDIKWTPGALTRYAVTERNPFEDSFAKAGIGGPVARAAENTSGVGASQDMQRDGEQPEEQQHQRESHDQQEGASTTNTEQRQVFIRRQDSQEVPQSHQHAQLQQQGQQRGVYVVYSQPQPPVPMSGYFTAQRPPQPPPPHHALPGHPNGYQQHMTNVRPVYVVQQRPPHFIQEHVPRHSFIPSGPGTPMLPVQEVREVRYVPAHTAIVQTHPPRHVPEPFHAASPYMTQQTIKISSPQRGENNISAIPTSTAGPSMNPVPPTSSQMPNQPPRIVLTRAPSQTLSQSSSKSDGSFVTSNAMNVDEPVYIKQEPDLDMDRPNTQNMQNSSTSQQQQQDERPNGEVVSNPEAQTHHQQRQQRDSSEMPNWSDDESQLDDERASPSVKVPGMPELTTKRKRRPPTNDPEERRRRALERNRLAASKCRQKKKEWMKSVEVQLEEKKKENDELRLRIDRLQRELDECRARLGEAVTVDIERRNGRDNSVSVSGVSVLSPDSVGSPHFGSQRVFAAQIAQVVQDGTSVQSHHSHSSHSSHQRQYRPHDHDPRSSSQNGDTDEHKVN